MGILSDPETEEVPGSILLMPKVSEFNEPLGLRNAPARTSGSSLTSTYRTQRRRSSSLRSRAFAPEKKRTRDGKIILEPQPDDSLNDPLNWKMWRRDLALVSLGFYCMLGGGMTPILAAGFDEVAADFNITVPQVALTTGLYMMGLGVGSAVLSPTAILFGKRPVYLCAAIVYMLTSVWCALSPNYASLVVARIFMGIAVSSVECLPSATVAEIFFLHEKAYRLGIYTLLLLGGKNLVPLVSAAIIQSLGWRWVFWIVAIIVAFGFFLLFFFVPETFWDRTPRPHRHGLHRRLSMSSLFRATSESAARRKSETAASTDNLDHVPSDERHSEKRTGRQARFQNVDEEDLRSAVSAQYDEAGEGEQLQKRPANRGRASTDEVEKAESSSQIAVTHAANSSSLDHANANATLTPAESNSQIAPRPGDTPAELLRTNSVNTYTESRRERATTSFWHQLRPYSGRLRKDNWFRVAFRPFVLYCYPSILWSALVYSLSVGWLIVLSESVAAIYEDPASYNFTSLQTGLVYISPFVGGVLGTAVAGKVSDIVVRFLSRKNGGVYEPEFRLVMGIPIAIFTTIGLMGYGWSAQERDRWIVPTIFFGFISFGCSLGSTTAITFAVDSYRQYAGEALVTLNVSKNILHGLVFSLFFNRWLEAQGSRTVFIAIGVIQLGCLLTTIPMYIYGKRARMMMVRKNLMERF